MSSIRQTPETVYDEYTDEIDDLAQRDDEVGAYFRAFKRVAGDSDD